MPSPFIDDGYTIETTIPAVAGKWDDVAITFRPMTVDEESIVFVRKSNNPLATTTRYYAEAFAGDLASRTPAKLLSWDLKDRSGKVVPITSENLTKLTTEFFDELRNNITLVKQPMEKNCERE